MVETTPRPMESSEGMLSITLVNHALKVLIIRTVAQYPAS
jgi:hypothetical protein